jgi:hypothetical protein
MVQAGLFFSGIKKTEREADNLFAASFEVKNT